MAGVFWETMWVFGRDYFPSAIVESCPSYSNEIADNSMV